MTLAPFLNDFKLTHYRTLHTNDPSVKEADALACAPTSEIRVGGGSIMWA